MHFIIRPLGRGLLLALAVAASYPVLAQHTPQSMLDVRLAAQEYEAAEEKEAEENAGQTAPTKLTTELLARHSATDATSVTAYLKARVEFLAAVEKRQQEIKALASTDLTKLQLQWLSKQVARLECAESTPKPATASATDVKAWYDGEESKLTTIKTALTAGTPTAPPTTEIELKKALAELEVDLEDCGEAEDVVFVRGLGEGLFTGSRLIPAVTILADVTHFQPTSNSAFIGGLEITGLNADALKQIDSSAVRRNLLYPELSTFGAGLTLGICKHSPDDYNYTKSFVGVLWRGSYLLKNLRDPAATTSETQQVGTDHLLSTLTVEYVVPKIGLAFFAGYSYQEVVGGKDNFRRLVETDVTSFSYLSWGLRGRLNVGSSKGTKNRQNINLEIGFIQLTDRMQRLLQTTDPLIPTIRVGFNHRILDNLKKS